MVTLLISNKSAFLDDYPNEMVNFVAELVANVLTLELVVIDTRNGPYAWSVKRVDESNHQIFELSRADAWQCKVQAVAL